jgi:hypothetical protein
MQTIVLGFLAGLMGLNALPHLIRGITAQEYPNLTGNSPVRNAVAGWGGLVIAGLLAAWSRAGEHPWTAFAAVALGALVMVVFHASGGAYRLNTRFGKENPVRQDR